MYFRPLFFVDIRMAPRQWVTGAQPVSVRIWPSKMRKMRCLKRPICHSLSRRQIQKNGDVTVTSY